MLITGDAGVGKTRLLSEFCKALDNTASCTLIGSAVEYVQAPYGPVIEAFSESPSSRAEIERALLAPRAASGGTGDEDRAQRFSDVERLLRRRASIRGAVVFVIEDLHWSDSATLDLLAYLVRRLRDVPVMLIGTYRPQDAEFELRRSAAISRIVREGAQGIDLGPLPDADIVKAIQSAVPEDAGLSEGEIDRIRSLSEGRPFVAEELLRASVESVRRGRPGDGGVVVSVRGSVMERVMAFDETDRQVLSYAAVIGREFDAKLLADITSTPLERIYSCLRQARRAQIVVENASTGTFTFRHAVTREVLYHELLISEARALHGRIAEHLESDPSNGRQSEIAYHWWAAHRARPAFETNRRAGDRAAEIFAQVDAAEFYERALQFAGPEDDRLGLLDRIANCLCATGQMERARARCEEAILELDRRGQREEALKLLLWIGRQFYESGQVEEALATVQRVRDELRERPATPATYTAETTYAAMLAVQGRSEETLAILDAAAEKVLPREPVDELREELARGTALCGLGRFEDGVGRMQSAVDIARRIERPDLLAQSLNGLGFSASLIGKMRAAMQSFDETADIARRHGQHRIGALAVANAACCALYLGDLERAREICDRGLLERTTVPRMTARAVDIRLKALVEGQDDETSEELERTFLEAVRFGESQVIAQIGGAAASLLLARGEERASADMADRALLQLRVPDSGYWLFDVAARSADGGLARRAEAILTRASANGGNPLATASLLLLNARVALRAEDRATALSFATRSAELYRGFGMPVEEAYALEVAGDGAGALAVHKRIGATREVRRLEDLLGVRRSIVSKTGPLSRREEQVAQLLVRGYSYRTIGAELGIGERTVETHAASVFRKLGVKTRVDLAARLHARASS